ncbi:MAG: HAD hydrolase-like protein [bacterium]
MQNKKYIIFDFDGTIADSIPVMFTITQEIAKEAGYSRPITQADWDWVREHELKDILGKFNIPLIKIPYILLEGRNKMKKQMYSVPPCKGMIDALKKLKKDKYELAVLSSSSRDLIQEFILKNDIVSLFDFVHSELNLFGKDKALLSLLKQFKMPIEQSIYVGDEMRDIDACKKIKLDCISVGWGLNSINALQQHGAQWTVTKPQDIIGLLNVIK